MHMCKFIICDLFIQVNYQDNKLMEHPQTGGFKLVLQSSIILNNIIKAVQDGDTSNLSDEGKVIFRATHFPLIFLLLKKKKFIIKLQPNLLCF